MERNASFLADVYILKQLYLMNLYLFSKNRFIHVPSWFPSPALVLLPKEKKKKKKGQHSQATMVSV